MLWREKSIHINLEKTLSLFQTPFSKWKRRVTYNIHGIADRKPNYCMEWSNPEGEYSNDIWQ